MRILSIKTLLFAAALAAAGCSSGHIAKLAGIAGAHWNCPASAIAVKPLGANTYFVKGCGNEDKLYCKGPADGCAFSEAMDRDPRPN